jgi:hypothetical protein
MWDLGPMGRLPLSSSGAATRWGMLGVSLAGAALPLLVLAVARPAHEVRTVAVWGAVLLLGFAGWGDLVRRALAPGADIDWGLRAAWGLALTIAVGGLLCLLGAARRPALVAWTCGGVALFAQALARRRWPGVAGDGSARPFTFGGAGWELLPVVGVACATVFVYLGAAGHTFPNPSDDWPAYLPFIRKLLQTGTVIEPFSVRRMAAYGGQTLLQAFALVVAGDTQIQIFDGGICVVLIIGLIIGFAREARDVIWTLLTMAALLVLMLPDGRANSASEMSGVVAFVAVWRTWTFLDRRGMRGRGAALLAALPLAAVATLRQNYLVPAAMMLFALLARGGTGPSDATLRWEDRVRFFWRVALSTGACLLPWLILALRSNHTFLFPIVHGNFHPEAGGISVPTAWHDRLKTGFWAIFHDKPIHPTLLFLVALPGAASRANRRATLGLWLGTMVGFALLCWSLPNTDNYTIARYDFAYVVGLAVVAGLAAAEGASETLAKRSLTAVGVIATALALQIYGSREAIIKTLDEVVDRLNAPDIPGQVVADPGRERRMQAAVPPGAPVLVMIDRPYLLDFARNPIELLDQPGAASPAPGIPLLAGSARVAAYLQSLGIRYLAFVRPEKAVSPLYSRTQWTAFQSGGLAIWRQTATYFLAAFDVVTDLAQRRHRLYDDGTLVVVDLAVSG